MSLPNNITDREMNKFVPSNSRPDRNSIEVIVDNFPTLYTIINLEHKYTHIGRFFSASHLFKGVNNNTKVYIAFRSTIAAHVLPFIKSRGNGIFVIYENSNLESDGTSMPVLNHNRNSSNISSMTAFYNPVINSLGTKLNGENLLTGGSGNQASGDTSSFTNEIIIKPNTNYLLELENTGGNNMDMTLAIRFYEPIEGLV
jgi:hypothetical protein